jgi:TrpR-related protein YerC/YecD
MVSHYVPSDKKENILAQAFLKLKTSQDVLNFLRDLMTPAEISEFAKRLEMAKLLKKGDKSYVEIAKEVRTSTTTVTRVAQWLRNGCGGYKKVI